MLKHSTFRRKDLSCLIFYLHVGTVNSCRLGYIPTTRFYTHLLRTYACTLHLVFVFFSLSLSFFCTHSYISLTLCYSIGIFGFSQRDFICFACNPCHVCAACSTYSIICACVLIKWPQKSLLIKLKNCESFLLLHLNYSTDVLYTKGYYVRSLRNGDMFAFPFLSVAFHCTVCALFFLSFFLQHRLWLPIDKGTNKFK